MLESIHMKRLTSAMREADKTFERVGGSTKHYVRDCLIPALEKHGLKIEATGPAAVVDLDNIAERHARSGQKDLLIMMLEKCTDGFTWYFDANGEGICFNAQNEDTGLYEDVEFNNAEEALKYFHDMDWL